MNIIAKLPKHVSNKISAGEVVQRPASVVKELLENSIDAGSSTIFLHIKDSGKTLIHVIDDGCGMSRDDAVLSFERFATSKIKTEDDLGLLYTMGFRGEALSSISAVSKVELKTRKRGDELGSIVEVEDGGTPKSFKVACQKGTGIIIRNLFYNVPARKKFLKSDQTEYKHIYEIIRSFSLKHLDIAWKFVSNNKTIFSLTSDVFEERVDFFFGVDFSKSLVPIQEKNDFLKLSGWLGKPAMTRRVKNEQFLFVNGRLVESRALSYAVYRGYKELLGEREYPFFFINVSIDPKSVDVNVHPSKMEIKFEDERGVFNSVQDMVQLVVSKMDFSPSVKIEEKPANIAQKDYTRMKTERTLPISSSSQKRLSYQNQNQGSFKSTNELLKEFKSFSSESSIDKDMKSPENSFFSKKQASKEEVVYQSVDDKASTYSDRFVWQIHNKHIVTQIKSGLMIIDQHAAHERILYERAIASMKDKTPTSQQLLFPQRIDMKPWELEVLDEIKENLHYLGFSFRYFGKDIVIVEGVPSDVKVGEEEFILQKLVKQYQEYKAQNILDVHDMIAKSYSCRSSIMAGDPLTQKEMNTLIDQLFSTKMPYTCPHGRPVIIKLSIEEIDKMFGRT